MGMYSSFDYEEIEVIDKDGLKRFLEEFKDNYVVKDGLTYDEQENTLSFENMHEWKIISYWYPEFVHMLRMLACFIEGSVKWTFESDDESGYVEFKDGELTIHCGSMQWSKYTADEMLTGRIGQSDEEAKKLVMPEWIKQRIAANRL